MLIMFVFDSEYSSKRELLESLQNETEDKVWLFECKQKTDLNSILIVNALEDVECMYVNLGVKITMLQEDNQNASDFGECMRQHGGDLDDRWTTQSNSDERGRNNSDKYPRKEIQEDECRLKTLVKNMNKYANNNAEYKVDVGNVGFNSPFNYRECS